MDVNGRVATTGAELDELLSGVSPAADGTPSQLYDIDHVYPAAGGGGGGGGGGDTVAILYGALGTQCFAALHAKLVAAASTPGEAHTLLHAKSS